MILLMGCLISALLPISSLSLTIYEHLATSLTSFAGEKLINKFQSKVVSFFDY